MQWAGETERQYFQRIRNWHKRFALFPTQMSDGSWVWLATYEVRFVAWNLARTAMTWERRAAKCNIWQHKKSGGLYTVIGECLIEADLTPATIYQSLSTRQIWVRPTSEFHDGRFQNMANDET